VEKRRFFTPIEIKPFLQFEEQIGRQIVTAVTVPWAKRSFMCFDALIGMTSDIRHHSSSSREQRGGQASLSRTDGSKILKVRLFIVEVWAGRPTFSLIRVSFFMGQI
jgi:hypothetical protein